MNIITRKLQNEDPEIISSAFQKINWHKPVEQYTKYLLEQQEGKRLVLIALVNQEFAGYVTVVWESDYPSFKK